MLRWTIRARNKLERRVKADQDLAGGEAKAVRERLRRAGLLAETGPRVSRPDPRTVAEVRKAAGRGRPLSEFVSEGRR